jgi:hypothetical protein
MVQRVDDLVGSILNAAVMVRHYGRRGSTQRLLRRQWIQRMAAEARRAMDESSTHDAVEAILWAVADGLKPDPPAPQAVRD